MTLVELCHVKFLEAGCGVTLADLCCAKSPEGGCGVTLADLCGAKSAEGGCGVTLVDLCGAKPLEGGRGVTVVDRGSAACVRFVKGGGAYLGSLGAGDADKTCGVGEVDGPGRVETASWRRIKEEPNCFSACKGAGRAI